MVMLFMHLKNIAEQILAKTQECKPIQLNNNFEALSAERMKLLETP